MSDVIKGDEHLNENGNSEPQVPKETWLKRIGRANASFAKNNTGILFSLIFYTFIIGVYFWGIRSKNPLTDRQYVKQYINDATPLEQINLMYKFHQTEEFTIDRDFFTKVLHVRPKWRNRTGKNIGHV